VLVLGPKEPLNWIVVVLVFWCNKTLNFDSSCVGFLVQKDALEFEFVHVLVFWYKKALKFYCSGVHFPLKKSNFGLMLNCIGFLHAPRKDFNFDVEFVIHGAKEAFNFDVNDGSVEKKDCVQFSFLQDMLPEKSGSVKDKGQRAGWILALAKWCWLNILGA
jgi:hypothetical protein